MTVYVYTRYTSAYTYNVLYICMYVFVPLYVCMNVSCICADTCMCIRCMYVRAYTLVRVYLRAFTSIQDGC